MIYIAKGKYKKITTIMTSKMKRHYLLRRLSTFSWVKS